MFDGVFFEFPKIGFVFFFFVACEAMCKLRERGIYFPHLGAFASVAVKPSYLLWFLKWASIIFLIVAMMSPVKETVVQPDDAQGYHIALVLDASESMDEGGFDPSERSRSRFDVVQSIVERFVAERPADEIGLIVFGTHAFAASPLTQDHAALQTILGRLYVGMAGKYTALYEALALSASMLTAAGKKNRIAIVLTDGRNTPGGAIGPDVAEALLKKQKVRLYAVRIGEPGERAPMRLEAMAEATGGRHFVAHDAKELRGIYTSIDATERSTVRSLPVAFKYYYFIYPLFAGFMTLLLYVFLRNRRAL